MMQKFMQRARSNSKGHADKKKKKKAESHVVSALTPNIIQQPPLPDTPRGSLSQSSKEKCCPITGDHGTNRNEGIYCMASDDGTGMFAGVEDDENVYESTDLVLPALKPTRNTDSAPHRVQSGSSGDAEYTDNGEDGLYDMADSLTSDCGRRVKLSSDAEDVGNTDDVLYDTADSLTNDCRRIRLTRDIERVGDPDQSLYDMADSLTSDCRKISPHPDPSFSGPESEADDIYSHLTTEESNNEYDHLERNRGSLNEVVYNALGDFNQNAVQTTRTTSSSSYEDTAFPSRQTSKDSNSTRKCSIQSDVSTDDTYEDVSINFPLKGPPSSDMSAQQDEGVTRSDDDTYEDVSSLQIKRFTREKQPVPQRPKLGLDIQSSSSPKSPTNTPRTPEVIPPTPESNDEKSITSLARNILKSSKAKHPSQWFSKPILKTKSKLDMKKRANSKADMTTGNQSKNNSSLNSPPVQLTEDLSYRPLSPNKADTQRLALASPTRVTLADSLEDNRLYKSMQEKLSPYN